MTKQEIDRMLSAEIENRMVAAGKAMKKHKILNRIYIEMNTLGFHKEMEAMKSVVISQLMIDPNTTEMELIAMITPK